MHSWLKQVLWRLHVRWQSFIDQRIHLAADHYPQESFKKRRMDIIDSAIELVTADQALHGLLNIEECDYQGS